MRKQRGWTLIEILVVIAIIAVLAGLIYAVGAYALERSRQATCVSNLRQIGMALKMYMEDYRQADWDTEIASYSGIEDQHERERLVARWGFPKDLYWLFQSGYIRDERLFKCSRSTLHTFRVQYAYHYPAFLYDPARSGLRLPPSEEVGVNTWWDYLWVLKQREWNYPIVADLSHKRGEMETGLILRLDGRVDKKSYNTNRFTNSIKL